MKEGERGGKRRKEEGRGGKRRKEEGRGGKRRKEEEREIYTQYTHFEFSSGLLSVVTRTTCKNEG